MNSPVQPHLDAMLDALDGLLRALEPEQLAEDRSQVPPDTVSTAGRVYGGQLLAQALIAAGRSVTGKAPHSLHASFVRAGTPGRPLELATDRVRDGRSMATRQVTVTEDGKPLLVAIAAFHGADPGPGAAVSAPAVPPPDELPGLQQWAAELPADLREYGRHWIERPPPIEFRMAEAPSFLGGPRAGMAASASRSHWMRLPRSVGDDPLLHLALLAYASDFLLMDMIFRGHPGAAGPGRCNGLSLDHAIWFHRPTRFDQWHLHTQEAVTIVGNRGLVRGAIHDADGQLVATVMQEVLVIPEATR
ncbi:acyl-CoA thioesterase [Pseudofrankia inefficax]|uniref:acyl-CoA thioesterase n=1 Tax=Pseudofrankia inefficax (strain DSM 45817 / CECT 9037 / DDB 130130 / EuI1c) TaxID=298654 RepID=UPI0007C481C2|nr:acyl-CoA thioesterase domain-containing protein [Pseudofrankia inefficax]